MDPWQPLNSEINGASSDGDVAKTTSTTLATILPQFHERKMMDSAQYLSIIGKCAARFRCYGIQLDLGLGPDYKNSL